MLGVAPEASSFYVDRELAVPEIAMPLRKCAMGQRNATAPILISTEEAEAGRAERSKQDRQ